MENHSLKCFQQEKQSTVRKMMYMDNIIMNLTLNPKTKIYSIKVEGQDRHITAIMKYSMGTLALGTMVMAY
jgi:hypothetical protein